MPPTSSTRTDPAAAPIEAPVLGKGFGFATLVVAVLAGAVWGLGCLPPELVAFYALGIVASLFAAMLALWLHGRFLDPRTVAPFARDGRLVAGRLQSLLAAAFGAKLAVLILGMVTLRQCGVKFEGVAVFCITFAAVSLVSQLATAGYLSRVMHNQLRRRCQDHQVPGTSSATVGPVAGGLPRGTEPNP